MIEGQIFLDAEYEIKRNYGGLGQRSQRVIVPGLRKNTTKDIENGCFYVSKFV